MPVLYQAKCINCDFESKYMTDHELAIIQDEPVESAFRHRSYPNLIVLAHPLEVSILEELGKSLGEFYRQGRVIGLHHNICSSCGNLFESFGFVQMSSGKGEWLSWLVSLTCGLVIYLLTNMIVLPVFLAIVAYFILSSQFDHAVHKKVLQAYSVRLKGMPDGRRCLDCGSEDVAPVVESKKAFPCTSCESQSVKIEAAAIS